MKKLSVTRSLAGFVLLSFMSLHAAAPTWAQSPVVPAAATRVLPALNGEVIVGFKPQSDTVRQHKLAARADRAEAQAVMSSRADALGQRHRRKLLAGAAAGEHAQVVSAAGVDANTLARQLAADPDVAYAVPNGRKQLVAAPNDPLYAAAAAGVRPLGPDSGQWYLRAPTATVVSAIDIEAAWARTQGSASVVVAVLDTGVRFEHPDLGRAANGGQLLPGYDFVSNSTVANDGGGRDSDPSDPGDWITSADSLSSTFKDCSVHGSSWHGTATASLVAAATNNSQGMAGAAPGVKVLPVRVLGKCFGSDADIQAGMRWAAGISVAGVPDNPNPAKVLNLSLGGAGGCDAAYQATVDQILARGAVIVAAAGNSAGGPVGVPANCRGVIGVLALRHAGTKVGFSDLGPEISIAAPGGNCVNITAGSACLYPILAATNTGAQGPVASGWTNSFDISVGTSFSSPLVAGVVALMFSQQPSLTPERVKSVLQSTARAFPTTGADNGPEDPTPVSTCHAPTSGVTQLQCYCTSGQCGAGMLNAGAAVAVVSGPLAGIGVLTVTPTAGAAVTLSAASSLAGPGAALTSYQWVLLNGGGIVGGFDSASNAATATLTPSAAGSFSVRLTIGDSLGSSDSISSTVDVVAAPVITPPVANPPASGGGGATSLLWVLGVLLAVALLHRPGLSRGSTSAKRLR